MEKIDLAIIDVIFHGQYSIAIHYITKLIIIDDDLL